MNLANENILNYVLVILVVRNIFILRLIFSLKQMINKSQKVSSLENIYKNLESGMPENKFIKDYAFPNARQWLGGRYVAIWVLPIYLIGKIAKFVASSAFIKPYSPKYNFVLLIHF